jgi:subtilisin family serine protease
VDDHATHVAGTIGAVGNNGQGTVGVNWQVSLMSVKVLGVNGGSTMV